MIRATVVLAAIVLAMARLGAQEEHGRIYVVTLSGSWSAGTGKPLRETSVIPAGVEEIARDAEYGSETDSLVLRDSRTLGLATIRCSPEARCRRPVRVASLQFITSPAVARLPRAASQRLFVRLGGDDLGGRARLAGARGTARTLGLLLLPVRGSEVDLGEVRSALAGESSEGLVVKLCPLARGSDDDFESCVDDREIHPDDCALARAAGCTRTGVSKEPMAMRLDIYARERSMLSTLAVASGFAVLVPPDDVTSVAARRKQMMTMLDSIHSELGAAELRALKAAAALELAAGR